uniref:Groucho/TLE N-terminal Q-rich domain-containing protein n=1 Tax=Spermophilus dauricus TaxID=99837 RepID=A0A8C9UMF7_SPEDA
MQRHYVMYYEMSYGLNIEMHKQVCLGPRLSSALRSSSLTLLPCHLLHVLRDTRRGDHVPIGCHPGGPWSSGLGSCHHPDLGVGGPPPSQGAFPRQLRGHCLRVPHGPWAWKEPCPAWCHPALPPGLTPLCSRLKSSRDSTASVPRSCPTCPRR